MSFNIGLSGMRAASKDLNVTGNNIANAGTVGFKQSRAEFADVYAASMGVSKNAVGSGVQLAGISQQFTQGNINYTQNALDLAINGEGFFQVSNNGALSYTRAGYFGTDRLGNLVDNFGFRLQGYAADENGLIRGEPGDLMIRTASQEPKATSKMVQGFNLNSTSNVPVNVAAFDASDPQSYNSSTSTNIFDSQGNSHVLSQYFVKTGSNAWAMNVLVDGAHPHAGISNAAAAAAVQAGGNKESVMDAALAELDAAGLKNSDFRARIASVNVGAFSTPEQVMAAIVSVGKSSHISLNVSFDSQGKLMPISQASGVPQSGIYDPNADPADTLGVDDYWQLNESGTLTLRQWTPANANSEGVPVRNGATASVDGIEIDIRGATQFASAFAVTSVSQDGYTTGELAGLEIDETGTIFARYTNGQSKVQGQILLATFANTQGLTPVGKTQWVQSYESGEPVIGRPGTGTLGALQSGALEDSNVELSDQLVNLIVAQRNYQANAKTIETESAVTQTIINLR